MVALQTPASDSTDETRKFFIPHPRTPHTAKFLNFRGRAPSCFYPVLTQNIFYALQGHLVKTAAHCTR